VFGRRNRLLLQWTVTCLIIIVTMSATVLFGMFYIDSSKKALTESIEKTQTEIKTEKLDQVQKEAVALSQGVKLIVQILSKEVKFSKLLQSLGTIMPSGTNLSGITLSNDVAGALDLTATATNYQAATQVQVNLLDEKNNLFSKVDTVSVSCDDGSQTSSTGEKSNYPCQILLRAQFKEGASVTFLATPTKGSN
jgi:Tfp pilus assembly protein PilN